ncbi:MAG TPA: hypothetical protein VIQ80_01185 [Candidatus Saccharimonadales bacterium]
MAREIKGATMPVRSWVTSKVKQKLKITRSENAINCINNIRWCTSLLLKVMNFCIQNEANRPSQKLSPTANKSDAPKAFATKMTNNSNKYTLLPTVI